MKVDLPLSSGIALQLTPGKGAPNGYPTARIQKGWLLFCDGHDLSEEAVGFGVPVIKRGLQTIFPGEVSLSAPESSPLTFQARYLLNLEERIAKSGSSTIDHRWVYEVKNVLAGAIRGLPAVRRSLTTASNLLRAQFGWQTTYEVSDFSMEIQLVYTVLPAENKLLVELIQPNSPDARLSEIILMNEQGAHHFDQYQDASGTRTGDQIGCWDDVAGPTGSFTSQASRLSFALPRVDGAHLYHGRELIGSRLAWSGFGYSFPPGLKSFRYEIALRRLA